jgi:CrcB protein
MSAVAWIGAAVLGGLAAIARFLLDGAVASRVERDFPYGTLAVNVTGAILLGLMVGLAVRGDQAVLVGAAAIGSYTTFSTWMFETHRLVEAGELANAFANATLSLALGIAAAAAGRWLGGQL